MKKENKKILDMCCGGKHFWFDKNNENVLFMDKRKNKQEKLYALHVKKMDVVIPMDLSDFYIGNPDRENVGAFGWAFTQEEMPDYIPLDKAPRSWQYAYLKGEVI